MSGMSPAALFAWLHHGRTRPRLNRVAWLDVPPIGTRRLSLTVMVPGFVSLRIPAWGDTSKLLRIEPSSDDVLPANVPICLPLEVTRSPAPRTAALVGGCR